MQAKEYLLNYLILSCKTGGGHDAAANAIKDSLILAGHDAFVFDYLTLRSKKTAKTVADFYIKTVQTAPAAFGFAYKIALAWGKHTKRSPIYAFNTAMVKYLKKYLEENSYDGIICTHLYPAETLTAMKRRGIATPPVFFVFTDYTNIPFVEETCADEYILPHKAIVEESIKRGLPAEKLHPFGIPVNPEMTKNRDKTECKTHLELDLAKKTVLLIGGSMGAGNLTLLSEAFEKSNADDIQVAIICGNNKKLFDELQSKYAGNPMFKIFGKTDEMPLFMTAADIVYTKPGGLTSTEAVACRKPLVLIYPIPGCESYNLELFTSLGMAITADTPEKLIQSGLELLHDATAQEKMIAAQKKNVSETASADIAEFIIEHTNKR